MVLLAEDQLLTKEEWQCKRIAFFNMEIKKSKYNYVIKRRGNVLLFNALYNTCVIMSSKEYQDFKKFKIENFDTYKRLGFVCDKNDKEEDVVLFTSRYVAEKDNSFFYRIYTTMACNAKCPYCYEKGVKAETMTKEKADEIINFIMQNARPKMHIILEWFGGEPLLNSKIIDYISKELTQKLEKIGAYFTSTMVTNGILFNEDDIEKYKNVWNLKKVQITLDGTKYEYEKIKGFTTKDAFEKVLSNIDFLSNNNIRVNIRLNYDKNNLNDIKDLIKLLGNKYSQNPNISVYARKIMAETQDNSFKASAKTDIEIYQQLINVGLLKDDKLLKTIPRRTNMCVAHMLNAYLVSPTGVLSKCSQALFDKNSVGDVSQGVDENELVKWCTPRLDDKCIKCKLLPICNGGCLYEKFNNRNFCYYSEKVLKFKLKKYLEYYNLKNQ